MENKTNIFKVWDEKNREWKNPNNFFLNCRGELVEMRTGKTGTFFEQSPFDLVKATSLTDEWENEDKKDNSDGVIYEGDYVYLHNWGVYNKDQVIGVAEVIWDKEYHQWSYEMIEGEERDSYDTYRQSPRVVGNKYENKSFEFSKDWESFLKEEEKEQELREEKRELNKERKKLNDENKTFQNQIKSIKEKQKLNENKLKELKKK